MESLLSNGTSLHSRCQTYEGGFGGCPGMEAHGGYSFCGLAALILLGHDRLCDMKSLLVGLVVCNSVDMVKSRSCIIRRLIAVNFRMCHSSGGQPTVRCHMKGASKGGQTSLWMVAIHSGREGPSHCCTLSWQNKVRLEQILWQKWHSDIGNSNYGSVDKQSSANFRLLPSGETAVSAEEWMFDQSECQYNMP